MWKCVQCGEMADETLGFCEKCGTDRNASPPEDALEQRAKRGSRARFEQILAKVSAAPPDPGDALE